MDRQKIKDMIEEASQFRAAIRVYNDRQVSREDMEFLLDIAHQSPSSLGLEGWRFIAFDNRQLDRDLKIKLKEVAWGARPQLDTASHFILLVADRQVRYDTEGVRDSILRRGLTSPEDLQARLDLYKAFQVKDTKMADDERALFDWAGKQTYIAMGNIMSSAALLGIDSCAIEGFHWEETNRILDEAGIIDQTKEGLVAMVSLGYRLRNPKHPKSRKPRGEVVSWLTD